jgi:hypothetical protein
VQAAASPPFEIISCRLALISGSPEELIFPAHPVITETIIVEMRRAELIF